ncbi:MAG: hypothetical protein IIY70_05330, partial [Oscillospiraceae bacterium]|nr:hypothetical protein [Oscillospiraceae bacterium]
MKKIGTLSLTIALTAVLLAGCTQTTERTGGTGASENAVRSTSSETMQSTETDTTEPDATKPDTTENAAEFRFTRENFPRLDGSTACLPMAEVVCSVLLGEDRDSVQDLIQFNRTTQSFRNLMEGECDLLL